MLPEKNLCWYSASLEKSKGAEYIYKGWIGKEHSEPCSVVPQLLCCKILTPHSVDSCTELTKGVHRTLKFSRTKPASVPSQHKRSRTPLKAQKQLWDNKVSEQVRSRACRSITSTRDMKSGLGLPYWGSGAPSLLRLTSGLLHRTAYSDCKRKRKKGGGRAFMLWELDVTKLTWKYVVDSFFFSTHCNLLYHTLPQQDNLQAAIAKILQPHKSETSNKQRERKIQKNY